MAAPVRVNRVKKKPSVLLMILNAIIMVPMGAAFILLGVSQVVEYVNLSNSSTVMGAQVLDKHRDRYGGAGSPAHSYYYVTYDYKIGDTHYADTYEVSGSYYNSVEAGSQITIRVSNTQIDYTMIVGQGLENSRMVVYYVIAGLIGLVFVLIPIFMLLNRPGKPPSARFPVNA